jgi:hypothetical protein
MTYILVIWTVVAGPYMTQPVWDWRPIGEFKSEAACHEAVILLALKPNRHRCLPTGKKSNE